MARKDRRLILVPAVEGRASMTDSALASREHVTVEEARRARVAAGIKPFSDGRPRSNLHPAKRWTVTASEEDMKAIDANAAECGLSRSHLVRRLRDPRAVALIMTLDGK